MTLRRPGVFLACFTLAVAVLLPLWGMISSYYLASLIWLVNAALAITGLPVAIPAPSPGTQEMVYPGLVGGMALFAVTPRSLGWKARWLAGLLLALCLLHASQLYVDAWIAVTRKASLVHGTAVPSALAVVTYLSELSRTWGTAAGVLLIWFAAVGMPLTGGAATAYADRRETRPKGAR